MHHRADGRLEPDTSTCDECGLCVAACPEGVLKTRLAEPLLDAAHQRAFWACEPAAGAPGSGVLPCLHAAPEQMLLTLPQRGIQHLYVLQNDCAACPRFPHTQHMLEQRLSLLNSALQSRGLPTITLVRTDAATWQRHVDGLQTRASRRGFFSALVKRPIDVLITSAEIGLSGNQAEATGIWLQTQGAGLLPATPVVDFSRCTLCGACASLCAHQAITLHDNGATARFTISPERCSACNLCVDVCLDNAISIRLWQRSASTSTTLHKHSCSRCKNNFWHLEEPGEPAGACPTCRQSGGKRPNRVIET